MKATVIGLPRCGKTSLLQALSGIEMSTHRGPVTVRIHDERLAELSGTFKPKKTTPSEIVLEEIAFEHSESRRRSMWERYVDSMKGSELFIHVLRSFADPQQTESPDPVRDLRQLDDEMVFADMAAAEQIRDRLKKEQREPKMVQALEEAVQWLENERPLRALELDEQMRKEMAGYNLVTFTEQLIVVNSPEDEPEFQPAVDLTAAAGDRRITSLPLGIASELAMLPEEEQKAFLEDMGLAEPAVDQLVGEILKQLDLITFYTANPNELRSWLIPRGTDARHAAGKVHSDLERGFIRAEVVHFDTLIKHGSLADCRSAGDLRQEGKDYIVQDGEILHIKFNV